MYVKTLEEYKGLPEGSCIYVKKELKTKYSGIWSSMIGSYTVSVPKRVCKIMRED